MAWINLASTRFRLKEEAEYLLDKWENATELSSWPIKPVLRSLQVGDAALARRAKILTHVLLEKYYRNVSDRDLIRPEVFPNIVGLSVVAHIDGVDQTDLWHRIVKAKTPPAPLMRALQDIVSRLIKTPSPITDERPTKPGQIYSEKTWMTCLKKDPVNRLYDLANSPDHSLWGYSLQPFVLPLGLLLHRAYLSSGMTGAPDIFSLLQFGTLARRHPLVLFERNHERPNALSTPKRGKMATWFGFDAIEVRNQKPYLYHYLGLNWQAPLLFEKKLNAFQFLKSIDLSWQLVEASLPATQWRKLRKLREDNDCIHVVVHDSIKAPVTHQALEEAGQHYGVNLEARDLMHV